MVACSAERCGALHDRAHAYRKGHLSQCNQAQAVVKFPGIGRMKHRKVPHSSVVGENSGHVATAGPSSLFEKHLLTLGPERRLRLGLRTPNQR